MKDKELLKLLIKNGWELKRVQGSHHVLRKKTDKGEQIEVIAVHGKDMPPGLLNVILKKTGLK